MLHDYQRYIMKNAMKYVLFFSPFVLVLPSAGSSSIGVFVGILIAIFLVSFLLGTLLVILITCCCVRRRKKSSGQLQPSYIQPEQLQPSYSQSEPLHVYSEVEIKCADTLEMKENVAYGPVGH